MFPKKSQKTQGPAKPRNQAWLPKLREADSQAKINEAHLNAKISQTEPVMFHQDLDAHESAFFALCDAWVPAAMLARSGKMDGCSAGL